MITEETGMKKVSNILWWGVPLLFFIGFAVFYSAFFSYQFGLREQLSLFLFTPEHFSSFLSLKGGLSKFVAAFLIQFFSIRWVGALMVTAIAALSWGAFRSVLNLYVKDCRQTSYLALLLPALLWLAFTSSSFPLDKALSVLAALAVTRGYAALRRPVVRRTAGIVLALGLWWCIGEAAFLTALLIVMLEWRDPEYRCGIYWTVMFLLYLAAPFVYRQCGIVLPVSAVFGIESNMQDYAGCYWGICFCIVFLAGWLFWSRKNKFAALSVLCVAISGILGYYACFVAADYRFETMSKMDWMARHRQWEGIVREMDKNPPANSYILSYYFLALAQTDQLGDRLLEKGVPFISSLVPGVNPPSYMPYTILSEIYWACGVLRGAQFCDYEAMGILNTSISGRHLKRAVESHLIFGEPEVAGRYLRILEKTALYRKWAREQLEQMKTDPSFDGVDWVREGRRFIASKPYLLNVRAPLIDVEAQALQQPDNRIANEYLMCCLLLQKDMERFKSVFDVYRTHCLNGRRMPVVFQEANLLYEHIARLPESERLSYDYDAQVLAVFDEYRNARSANERSLALGNARFSQNFLKSYFYYHDFTSTVTQ